MTMVIRTLLVIVLLASRSSSAVNCTEWWLEPNISDAFAISSTNSQTAFGIIQVCLIWTNVLGDWIYYKKADNARVLALKKEQETLRRRHRKRRRAEPRLGRLMFREVLDYYRGDTSRIRNKEELIEHVKFLRDLLAKRSNEEYSTEHESD
ncbi:MAG TPA: hypothetical protein VEL47_05685 [Myxococcota bacterium]|nr:hypothetical protein [Myxococcota bacterium]